MIVDINYIKANILDYEISFSLIGWTVKEIGSEYSLCMGEDFAQELICLMKIAQAR